MQPNTKCPACERLITDQNGCLMLLSPDEAAVFTEWHGALTQAHMGGSGIPKGYVFNETTQEYACGADIHIYPVTMGLIILKPDGTWTADGAPFAG